MSEFHKYFYEKKMLGSLKAL